MSKDKTNWQKLQEQDVKDTIRNRDVYDTQQMERSKIGKKQSFLSRHIICIATGLLAAFLVWLILSFFNISTLNNKAAEDAGTATVITEQAPDEPRNLSDVKWANMLLVEDTTYAAYGYTYMDTRTGIKYTKAEYEIWLDVQRRIISGQCPDLIQTVNSDGTYTYTERPIIAEAPESPRDWSDADYANFAWTGIVEDDLYADMGYYYRETYSNNYLTYAEYVESKKYSYDYIQSLIDDGVITFTTKDGYDDEGHRVTITTFYDVDPNEVIPQVPTEAAGTRYYTPISKTDLEWANMRLEKNSSASTLGYAYMDTRTGEFYTVVEYEKWYDIYQDALYGRNGRSYWMYISDVDGYYAFSETPPYTAPDDLRDFVQDYLYTRFMKMNLTANSYWQEWGYYYYDSYTRLFYSEPEYQKWLSIQNQVASGELRIPTATQTEIREQNIKVTDVIAAHLDPVAVKYGYGDAVKYFAFWKFLASFVVGLSVYGILRTVLKRNLDAQNLMNDTSDINQYENDQHIALPEEVQRKFDWFPDAGAHCPIQVSSMISHMMITNKGLNKVKVTRRAEKNIVDNDGNVLFYKGEALVDKDGNELYDMLPMIDSEFADALYEASGSPKEVRKYYDPTKIPYNPDGKDRTKQLGTHKTVADAINKTWTFPSYEPQRPAGAYIVDTEPVNTMVLAITRAGKGQTVIEPTIDMWTRETRPNNMVINDPKGELLVKNYVRGTVRGFQIVQFNLINAMKTDIYNPLGMAADAAREGDFTKCAMYVDNVASVFFPVDGADDPVWPNAANNAVRDVA